MSLYFKFKLLFEFLVPFALLFFIILFLIVFGIVQNIKYNRKCKFLQSKEFTRKKDIFDSNYKIERFYWENTYGFKIKESKMNNMKYKKFVEYVNSNTKDCEE